MACHSIKNFTLYKVRMMNVFMMKYLYLQCLQFINLVLQETQTLVAESRQKTDFQKENELLMLTPISDVCRKKRKNITLVSISLTRSLDC